MPNRAHPCRLSAETYAEPNHVIFLTLCAVDRRPVFGVEAAARLTQDAIRVTCQADNLHLVAYCVMPDHVHLVLATEPGSEFQRFVRRFKGVVTQQLHHLGIPGLIWERSYWDRHARAEEDVQGMVEYVLANPVRQGLCEQAEAWPHSAFEGLPG